MRCRPRLKDSLGWDRARCASPLINSSRRAIASSSRRRRTKCAVCLRSRTTHFIEDVRCRQSCRELAAALLFLRFVRGVEVVQCMTLKGTNANADAAKSHNATQLIRPTAPDCWYTQASFPLFSCAALFSLRLSFDGRKRRGHRNGLRLLLLGLPFLTIASLFTVRH